MTRETKVGLLVGMGVILLIGIIVSDHLAVMQKEQRELSDFANQSQDSLQAPDHGDRPSRDLERSAPSRHRQPPAAEQRERAPRQWTPDLDFGPGPDIIPSPTGDRIADRTGMPPAYALDDTRRDDPRQAPAAPPRNDRNPRNDHNDHDEFQPLDDDAAYEDRFADERHRTEPRQADEPEAITHRVQRHETLYVIAEKYYGDGRYWHTIAEHNAERILNGEHVREGVELVIPNRSGLANIADTSDAATASERAEAASARTIEVRPGDTLGALAAEHLGSSRRWRELLEANSDQLTSDRDLRAGMTLRLPGETAAPARATDRPRQAPRRDRTYVVRRGDTLTRIAERELGDGSRWRELYEANRNKLDSPDSLPVGEELHLPS